MLTFCAEQESSTPSRWDCALLPSVGHSYYISKKFPCSIRRYPDTGDAKRDLCLKLGAEKWIDFKTSTNLVKDVKDATGGLGPHSAVVVASNVNIQL